MPDYNPNPFDFVPFAEKPFLRTVEEYDKLGSSVSGYLEVKLRALTPVHIVGYLNPEGGQPKSYMYRQNDQACIPAASVRGCLRAFIEALTSGWVSQATPDYPKVSKGPSKNRRHVGFSTFAPYHSEGKKQDRMSCPAVDPSFKPQVGTIKEIDIASYLFGMVLEPNEGEEVEHKYLARKSKIWIEDAFIVENDIVNDKYWIPDVAGEAFMGGANPSASNWWYFEPQEIWERHVRLKDGRVLKFAEFIGDKFRGRKFYYHQDPVRCIKTYDTGQFVKVQLQCLNQNATTEKFRIYLDRIPSPLVRLLLLVLMPGKNIRHKLGYGKPYGYGSIEFTLEKAMLRNDIESGIPAALEDKTAIVKTWPNDAWDKAKLISQKLDETIIDWQGLKHLAQILGWKDYEKLKFTYPPYIPVKKDKRSDKSNNFARTIDFSEFTKTVSVTIKTGHKLTTSEADTIARDLFSIKKPIHFRYYQENAQGWDIIFKRKP